MSDSDRALDPDSLLRETSWMRTMAVRLVGDLSLADDVVQQACMAALDARAEPTVSRGAWLRGVVRNLSRQTHRERARRRRREEAVARPERVDQSPDAIVGRAELQRHLVDAVLALDEPYRSTVILRFFEDRSPKEIAKQQRVPAATVYTRLTRAIEMLRGRLDQEYGGRTEWCVVLAPLVATTVGGTTAGAAASEAVSEAAGSSWIGGGGGAFVGNGVGLFLAGAVLFACGVGAGRWIRSPEASEPSTTPTVSEPLAALEGENQELRDRLVGTRAAIDEVQGARAELTSKISSLATRVEELEAEIVAAVEPSPAEFPIRFGEYASVVEATDWSEAARAVAEINRVLLATYERDPNELTGRDLQIQIAKQNSVLVEYATELIQKIPTHARANGEFTHPISMATLMVGLLDQAGLPLDADQYEEFVWLGEEYDRLYAAKQETYDASTYQITKFCDELELKWECMKAMRELLTPEQLALVVHPPFVDRLSADPLSPANMALATVTPYALGEEATAISWLTAKLAGPGGADEAALESHLDVLETWRAARASCDEPISEAMLQFLSVRQILDSGRARVALFTELSERGLINEEKQAFLRSLPSWIVPVRVAE